MTFCPKTGKICYDTRLEANGAAASIHRRRRHVQKNLQTYKCPYCSKMHLGRPPKKAA